MIVNHYQNTVLMLTKMDNVFNVKMDTMSMTTEDVSDKLLKIVPKQVGLIIMEIGMIKNALVADKSAKDVIKVFI